MKTPMLQPTAGDAGKLARKCHAFAKVKGRIKALFDIGRPAASLPMPKPDPALPAMIRTTK